MSTKTTTALTSELQGGLKMKSLVGKELVVRVTKNSYGSAGNVPYPFWSQKDKHVFVKEEYQNFYVVEVLGFVGESSTSPATRDTYAGYKNSFMIGSTRYVYESRMQTLDKIDIRSGLMKVLQVKDNGYESFIEGEVTRFINETSIGAN